MTTAHTTYRVDVPMLPKRRGAEPVPPLNENDRWHHHERARRTLIVRLAVRDAARAAKIPAGTHLTVTLHYAPGNRRPQDADNLVPTLKAACDALARGKRRDWVGLELVPTDTPEHMTKRMPVIHFGPGERRCWLEIEVTP